MPLPRLKPTRRLLMWQVLPKLNLRNRVVIQNQRAFFVKSQSTSSRKLPINELQSFEMVVLQVWLYQVIYDS